jgi:hypothetical protein
MAITATLDNNAGAAGAGGSGDGRGKKTGVPENSIMAEQRRKKLNDLLYMLPSVVSKIRKVIVGAVRPLGVTTPRETLTLGAPFRRNP